MPARTALHPQPVSPIMNTWRHNPRLRHTHASSLAQLIIQYHLNHLYHPVIGEHKTYAKLNLRHPKIWITSMFN